MMSNKNLFFKEINRLKRVINNRIVYKFSLINLIQDIIYSKC